MRKASHGESIAWPMLADAGGSSDALPVERMHEMRKTQRLQGWIWGETWGLRSVKAFRLVAVVGSLVVGLSMAAKGVEDTERSGGRLGG